MTIAFRTAVEAQKARVLVVDDDRHLADVIVEMLEACGLAARSANGVEEALHDLARCHFDVVLCDVEMPGKSGLDLLAELGHSCPELPVVLMSAGQIPLSASGQAVRTAFGFLGKPFSRDDLADVVGRALMRSEPVSRTRCPDFRR